MDYKELIEIYRSYAARWEHGEQLLLNGELCLQGALRDAATAIETLLAERDAAMKYIPKVCSTCKHWDSGGCNAPITGGECAFDLRQAWQWRGPQKGEA